mmetsp:Transcript_49084/g.90554  ORF Transcript_49084/g.90554 Transcript_49084/m.90554 type:complete len:229 (-) Transcript_49084:589-1275(-)
MRIASASDCALMSLALALPLAASSACCAPAAATAPALKASSSDLSTGTADTTLMDSTSTPYWPQISLAWEVAVDICCVLKILAMPVSSFAWGDAAVAAGPSRLVMLPLAATWTSSAYLTLPIAAAREAIACCITSCFTMGVPALAPLAPSMVSAAILAARTGSRTRQLTVAFVCKTTLSAVVALKPFRVSVWIFKEMNFSNFQLRCVSICVWPPDKTICLPLSWVTAA